MQRQHFFLRLIPPRPTFPADMTEDEKHLMAAHAAYTRTWFDAGKILVYGPVLAKEGTFGMAVIEVEEEAEARRFIEGDPTIKAGLNTFTLAPMHVAAARGEPQVS